MKFIICFQFKPHPWFQEKNTTENSKKKNKNINLFVAFKKTNSSIIKMTFYKFNLMKFWYNFYLKFKIILVIVFGLALHSETICEQQRFLNL